MHPTAKGGVKEQGGDVDSVRQGSSPSSTQVCVLGQVTSSLRATTSSFRLGRILEDEQGPQAQNHHDCLPRGRSHTAGLPLPAQPPCSAQGKSVVIDSHFYRLEK